MLDFYFCHILVYWINTYFMSIVMSQRLISPVLGGAGDSRERVTEEVFINEPTCRKATDSHLPLTFFFLSQGRVLYTFFLLLCYFLIIFINIFVSWSFPSTNSSQSLPILYLLNLMSFFSLKRKPNPKPNNKKAYAY